MKPILQVTEQSNPLTNDPTILHRFKGHCGLPTKGWTEADTQLKSMLNAAEKIIVGLTNHPFRLTTFLYQVHCIPLCNGYYKLQLPVYPITDDVTIDWESDNETGTYTEGEEFSVYGHSTLTPEIIFTKGFSLARNSTKPYPFSIHIPAGPSDSADLYLLTIFELAGYYYRNPEAMNDVKPQAGPIFNTNLDMLANHFL